MRSSLRPPTTSACPRRSSARSPPTPFAPFSRSGSSLLTVELRHLGGAIGRHAPEHGAISAFDAEFAVFAAGIAPTPEAKAKVEADSEKLLAALGPWTARQTYMNFVERREDPRRFVSEQAYHRLRRIKDAVDPRNTIRSNHPLEA